MNIRKRILISTILLTVGCGIAVLLSSIILYGVETDSAMQDKMSVAHMVVEHEISNMKAQARVAAIGMASNPDLIAALESNERDRILYTANALLSITSLDYCVIIDNEGYVITRTHDPGNYGDNVAGLPHVRSALTGATEAYIIQGITIPLAASAGSPIYDQNNDLIGIVSLGFRLDNQNLVYTFKNLTGCEVSLISNGERIASTLIDEDGTSAHGSRVDEGISGQVLAGNQYTARMQLYGRDILATFTPLYGVENEIVGMIFVGYYTSGEAAKLRLFAISGALITFGVLLLCVLIAGYISKSIEQRMKGMMDIINESNERMMLMLDTSPVCAQIWDRNLNTIDCNEAGVKLYGFRNKQDYIERFLANCSPEYQPDGQRSDEKATRLVNEAFEDGYCKFDWMHKMPDDDTPIPAEVTLVRGKYRDEDVVIGYTRDLRDYEKMMKDIRDATDLIIQRDVMLNAVNEAAVLLLTTEENENIVHMLASSMERIGRSIKADRIQLWRNETIDGEMSFVHFFQWLNDTGKHQLHVPIGMSHPYSNFPDLELTLSGGDVISGSLSGMSEHAQAFLGGLDIKSIVVIPLFLDEQFWGFFSFDDCVNERDFSEDEISILRSVSLMIASAINRQALVVKRTHELAMQTTMLSTLIDTIPDMIFLKDPESRFVQCNKSFLEHFGRIEQDVIGKSEYEGLGLPVETAERFLATDKSILANDCLTIVEDEELRSDGTFLSFETIITPLKLDGASVGLLGIARNITKRKEMEHELREARNVAEVANQAKSSFLASMSHEIRTPMNSILGVTDILMQKDIISKDVEDGLNRIYTSCDMLLGIINDILDFSKIEAGRLDIRPAQYETASLINDSVQLNMTRIYGKPIEFEVEVDENVPAKLVGDELRIKQIMNNLLSNAFKYTDSGKVTLSVVSEAMPDGESITLVLIVRDTGRGMTEEQLSKLFDEYSRFEESSGTAIEGTGLGLAITRRLIDLMNGGIHVESHPGVGSMFAIKLPQKTVDSSVLGSKVSDNFKDFRTNYVVRKRRGQISRNPMPYGSVLIVDDIEANLYVAEGLMQPYGMQIDRAMSGQEVIDKIRDGRVYDVVFMDHMMPDMDGIEATKRLREMSYEGAIVALTANAVAGQEDVFLKNGFNDYISKPIDIRQLDVVLNKLVRDKHPPEVVDAARRNAGYMKESASESKSSDVDAESAAADIDPPTQTGMMPAEPGNASSWLLESNIAGLNIADGLKLYDGDDVIYLKILRSYMNSVRLALETIEDYSGDKLLDYRIKVHGIKGASMQIFAGEVARMAGELEDAATSGDYEFIDEHNPKLVEAARALVNDIEKVLPSDIVKVRKPTRSKPGREVLSRLFDACNSFDLSQASATMSEIEKYEYISDDGLVSWLRENIDMMNYPEIAERLSDLITPP